MPPKVVLTNRKIRNSDVGIDISVPSHEHALSPKLVKNYHVLVITSLPHFKSAVHSEDAVVQFMVPRDYETFEELQKDMLECFQHLKLPNLPRKYHLLINDADIEERQIAFDCLLKVLCRDKDICTSPIFLRFLGFDPLADKVYFKRRMEYRQRGEHETTEEQAASLFKPADKVDPVDSYLSCDGIQGASEAEVTVGRSNLFISPEQYLMSKTGEHSQLLDVPETTEDVLATVQQTRKTMVGVGLDKSAQKDCTDIEVKDIDVGVMATDEILTYIQCNTAKEDDLDLF